MSKTWRWILGIFVVLVVVAALGFLAWNAYGSMRWSGRIPASERVRPPMMEQFGRGDRNAPWLPDDRWHMPMMGAYDRFHSPMGGYWFLPLPLLFFGGLLRLVVPLGVLALVAYVAYQQGKKAGMQAVLAANAPEPKPETSPKSRGRKIA